MTVSFINATTAQFGGCATGTRPVAATWKQPTQPTGMRRSGSCASAFWPETTTPLTLFAKAGKSHLRHGRIIFLRSIPSLKCDFPAFANKVKGVVVSGQKAGKSH